MIAALRPYDEFSRRTCFEFRMGIEGESAAAAARNHSPDDLQRLRAAIDELELMRFENSLGLDEDFEFHLAVAQASGNHYFVSALLSSKDTIYEGMLLARSASGLDVPEKIAAINHQHRLVYDAISAGDADAARGAMRGHLTRCRQSTSHWDTFATEP